MKLRCDATGGTVSVGGASFEIKDSGKGYGVVDVPAEFAGELVSGHGLRDDSAPDRQEVRVVEVPVEVEKVVYRETPEDEDPTREPPTDIAKMKRNELFAALRAKGVAVVLPKTNGQLRNELRRAFDLQIVPEDEKAPADSGSTISQGTVA